MQCPKCRGEMKPQTLAGVEIDRCETCAGLWFDALESRDLRETKGAAAIDTGGPARGVLYDTIGNVRCPRCDVPMIRMVDREQPHVWYEECSVCYGSYFDAGEFKDLTEHSLADLFKQWRKGERRLD